MGIKNAKNPSTCRARMKNSSFGNSVLENILTKIASAMMAQ